MENMLYLLNMSVAGIKSIKEEIRLDFYKKTVDKNFNPDKYRIKAIYGENGWKIGNYYGCKNISGFDNE